jgi:RelB antitoxin
MVASDNFLAAGFDEAAAIVVRMHSIGFGQRRLEIAANALVQTRIAADVRDRASAVLGRMGLTISDALRILPTRTAN